MKWRISFLILLFGFLYSALVFNIYNIQVKKGNEYQAKAESQQAVSQPARGNIYFTDKNNNSIPAALNKDFPIIYAVPSEIADAKETASALSQVINRPAEDLEKILSRPKDQYELLVQKAGDDAVKKVRNLKLKGIYTSTEFLRFYPFENLAAHLLGFVAPAIDNEFIGRYGLEKYFNDLLTGKLEEKKGNSSAAQNGDDLYIAIDRNIQAEAEQVLKKIIGDYSAESGTVIVQEPKSGKILAMASFPDFDPNNYSESSLDKFLNPATQAIYEPGSVFKIITMAAGINSNKITPDTAYIDTGSVILNGKKIENWDKKAHGRQTMTGVIEQSINTGAVFAEQQTGHDIFYNYLIKFGFNKITGIDLPGEVKGNINNLRKGKDIDFATASYGQGVSVTPIQLIKAFSAVANGGVMMKPIILAGDKPEAVRRVISEDTAKKVIQMMVSSVEANHLADIKDYSVAGKTGTAFVPDLNKGGYTDQVVNTYIGFAPAFAGLGGNQDSKFVVLIKLDKPIGSPLAGTTVVPAFRELMQFILNYYNITPDKI